MTDIKQPWRLTPNGPLLGYRLHVSPYNGAVVEAVVNLDTNTVIACHGATCQPHQLITPPASSLVLDLKAEEVK